MPIYICSVTIFILKKGFKMFPFSILIRLIALLCITLSFGVGHCLALDTPSTDTAPPSDETVIDRDTNRATADTVSTIPTSTADPGDNTGSCPVSLLLTSEGVEEEMLSRFRDTVLAENARGINYTRLYYINSPEITLIFLTDDTIKTHAQKILHDLLPVVSARLKKGAACISQRVLDDIDSLINEIARSASPALKDALRMVKSDLIKKTIFEELKIRIVQ
jgi:hypothetical protein